MAENIVPLHVRRSTFKLGGEIELEGYTADEMRADGSFVNYLSGRGISKSIELSHSVVVRKRLPKELKAFLGNDFMVVTGTFDLSNNRLSKVDLWPTEFAANFFLFYAMKGNAIAIQFSKSLLAASLDTILNDKFGRASEPGAVLSSATRYFRETPKAWDLHFDAAWQKESVRCLKLPGQGQAMAKFIVDYVYRHLGLWDELKALNTNPNRDRYHQYLTKVASEDVVKKHIHAVYMLLCQSGSRAEFKMKWANYTGGSVQPGLF